MVTQLDLGGIAVDVVFKDIKNVHLSVHPPTGRVRISAPTRTNLDAIRAFAISKLGWIKQQQGKLRQQERESPREYLERESHHVWGRRYLMEIREAEAPPLVELTHRKLVLRVRPGTDEEGREAVVAEWYRGQLKQAARAWIIRWEPRLGVKVRRLFVQRMKTKWGGCNPEAGSIRLNSELAKKPPECGEYVLVHEMAHLIERHHNDRFVGLMDRHLPQWRAHRDALNAAPLAHESWTY